MHEETGQPDLNSKVFDGDSGAFSVAASMSHRHHLTKIMKCVLSRPLIKAAGPKTM